MALPGLYVHVPFCARVCPYCDFAVRTGSPARRARWLEALDVEIELAAAAVEPAAFPAFDTIYLGGGTPSLLTSDQLAHLLERLRAVLPVHARAGLFLEANPEDVTPESLAAWRALGVGFLSLGVQSLDDAELRFLGRAHDGRRARRAVEDALAAGFPTVSVDLIYGLPGQATEALRARLAAIAGLGTPHVSAYQLSLPEGTRFGRMRRRGELREPDEDEQAEAFRLVHEALATAGLAAYEVSNFARGDAYRSSHNRKYWEHVPYLGLGPGAHSFDGCARWWNERRADDYESRLARGERPVSGSETLTRDEQMLEAVALGLRITEGIDLARFRARFGVDLASESAASIARLSAAGLVALDATALRATLAGWAVADRLAVELAPPRR